MSRPDHAYAIYAQRRIQVRRGHETFLVASGRPEKMTGVGLFRTRKEAQRKIMEIVNAPDWEHRNLYAAHYFYWAKRIDLRPADRQPSAQ